MPRNGSGTYTLPEAAFVSGTVISSTAVNSDFSDIGNAITDSLARDGQGGMTDTLPLSTTGFIYSIDPNTGMYRTGADAQAIRCGGTDILEVTTAGVDITGALTRNGIQLLPVGLGPLPWGGVTTPAGWLLCYGQAISRTTYADLFAVYGTTYGAGDGSTTFNIQDMRGNLPYGKNDMGGSGSSRLSTTYYGANPATLGALGGVESTPVGQGNLPNVSFPVTDPGHAHPILLMAARTSQDGTGASYTAFATSGTTNPSTSSAVTGISVSSGGSGTPVSRIAPGLITNYIIYAGV